MKELDFAKKVPKTLRFDIENWISHREPAYLEALKKLLTTNSINPDHILYSGFDASDPKDEKIKMLFAMNETGWLNANNVGQNNAADHALEGDQPCIGIYDINQLAEAYHWEYSSQTDPNAKEILEESIIVGEPLVNADPKKEFNGLVVHVNYPQQSPNDALVCKVYI